MAKTKIMATRPLGITILAVLEALGGVLAILGGLIVSAIGSAFLTGVLGAALGAAAGIFGGILVIIGLVALVIAYGLWTGKKWAWWLAVIFSGIGVIGGLFSLIRSPGSGIVQIIIDGIIIYYLMQKQVKGYFGA